ncbi:phosphodiester glycosidase family protein [Candidatus Roizmanbacteria bacterium]|nr:MAG: phosphodiester glycosidase family protein [Candidatus Roizmanbacteria bacterium]
MTRLKLSVPKIHLPKNLKPIIFIVVIITLALSGGWQYYQTTTRFNNEIKTKDRKIHELETQLEKVGSDLFALKQEDQYVRNEKLQNELEQTNETFSAAVETYEELVQLKETAPKSSDKKIAEFEKSYAEILTFLSKLNYASAQANLASLNKSIIAERSEISSSFTIPSSVSVNNVPPSSGYSRQSVETSVGTYMVDIISADLNNTRVIVDTASESDCRDNCPVDSLGSYAARSGAFAGINGPYFCPASYPSCAGKANSFDTLLMNKNKYYFNSDNNVYSTVPAVIFSGNSGRFVGASQEWGRDTGVDSVIASQPLLTLNGNRVFGGDGEPKRSGKGSRSFIGTTGSTVYIGVVHNVSAAEMAHVLQTLGISSSLNLDSGGSTALWSSGRYIVGPGRNTPFGILLVSK